MRIHENLQSLIKPLVESLGYAFWGIEYFAQGRYSTLRVYIDHTAGITLEDCARVSDQISALLDVEDPIKSQYTLEVSSPGLDRILFTKEQVKQFLGEKAEIVMHVAIAGQRRFKGILALMDETHLHLLMAKDKTILLPFSEIDKIQLVY